MTPPFLRTEPGADPVIAEGIFPASPARVYRAWTTAEEMRQWFGSSEEKIDSFEIDLRVGGSWNARFAMQEDGHEELSGRYTALTPDQMLAFTWQHHRISLSGARESTPESLVTVTLTPHGESTQLKLVHSKVQSEGGRTGVGRGWNEVLGRLVDAVAVSR